MRATPELIDLAARYPWPEGPWLRSQMVMTLDGATVGPDGLSGSISGKADKAVFLETRRLADAVLVGAATIRAERYTPMRAKAQWQQTRAEIGAAPAPRIVIVSASLDLPWDEPLFSESDFPITVATIEDADSQALAVARNHSKVVHFGIGEVDVVALVEWMRAEGLQRVVCEGGEVLLDQLVRADLVDEMNLTIAPMVVAGKRGAGPPTDARWLDGAYPRFDLAHQFVESGFVFCRFLHRDRAASGI